MPNPPESPRRPDPLECSWIQRQARRLLGGGLRRHLESTDLVNEVLLREEQARDRVRFVNRRARRGWLLRVLHNLIASEARRRGPMAWEDSVSSSAARIETPSRIAQENEEGRNARRLLDALSERDRAVVHLRVVENETFIRIAERLGLSEGNARVIFHRSLQALRRSADADPATER
ncbi:MAG: sigma-70 family RNA polymerase sigma factor [Planctomycetota bacterium]|nr:MAG: sigma-70 family RNA polymerase sigma factor [Planctomycetota bacterium]